MSEVGQAKRAFELKHRSSTMHEPSRSLFPPLKVTAQTSEKKLRGSRSGRLVSTEEEGGVQVQKKKDDHESTRGKVADKFPSMSREAAYKQLAGIGQMEVGTVCMVVGVKGPYQPKATGESIEWPNTTVYRF